jgi:hypothetical protein
MSVICKCRPFDSAPQHGVHSLLCLLIEKIVQRTLQCSSPSTALSTPVLHALVPLCAALNPNICRVTVGRGPGVAITRSRSIVANGAHWSVGAIPSRGIVAGVSGGQSRQHWRPPAATTGSAYPRVGLEELFDSATLLASR